MHDYVVLLFLSRNHSFYSSVMYKTSYEAAVSATMSPPPSVTLSSADSDCATSYLQFDPQSGNTRPLTKISKPEKLCFSFVKTFCWFPWLQGFVTLLLVPDGQVNSIYLNSWHNNGLSLKSVLLNCQQTCLANQRLFQLEWARFFETSIKVSLITSKSFTELSTLEEKVFLHSTVWEDFNWKTLQTIYTQ